jgi:hypothetical protein
MTNSLPQLRSYDYIESDDTSTGLDDDTSIYMQTLQDETFVIMASITAGLCGITAIACCCYYKAYGTLEAPEGL